VAALLSRRPSNSSVGRYEEERFDRTGLPPANSVFGQHHHREPRIEKGLDEVEIATLEWVDWWNHRRLLEPIGRIPPAEAEATYYSRQAPRGRGRDSGNRASMQPGAVQQVGTEPVKDREGLDRLFGQGDRGRNWARSKHAIPEEGG
jgi:hypothetical protein